LAVARRALANRRRTTARQVTLHWRLGAERTGPALGPAERSEIDGAVLGALGQLNERDREALLLVAWEGLTPAQAAVVLGVRPNTFSTRLSRARRRFRRALNGERIDELREAHPTAEPSR